VLNASRFVAGAGRFEGWIHKSLEEIRLAVLKNAFCWDFQTPMEIPQV
jgi:hypothetical protein